MVLETLGDGGRTRGIGERTARKASKGKILFRRWAGCWIDFIAMAVLLVIAAAIAGAVYGAESINAGPVVLVVLTGPLYFLIGETVWGRTLGKLCTGMVVVDAAGNRPGFWRVCVRTAARLIEVNPFLMGGLPAGLSVIFTDSNQRIGDLMAKTYVVPVSELRAMLSKSDAKVAEVFT
jgi:uncharacterized RDD family membrane protein YckC